MKINILGVDFMSFVGHTGSGKSTLLSIIGGILKATSGTIYYDSFKLNGANEDVLASFRREYFSYIYCLNRRILVLESSIWNTGWSREIKDIAECIRKRVEVFTKYFSTSELSLPEFIKPFQNTEYNPGFLEMCYGDKTYGEWDYTWSTYTGRSYYDWTREDQLFHTRFSESIEQYLELHENMVLTMKRLELLYYADLSIIQGVSGIWNFMNGDIDGEEKSIILNKVYNRLVAVGNAMNADMSKYKEMAEKLKEEAANYYDVDAVLDILGWKIYI